MKYDSADRICKDLAASQNGLVTRTQALEAGLGPRAIRLRKERGEWLARRPDVFAIAGAPRTRLQDIMATCLWAGSGSATSHRTAAELWQLGFSDLREIEITTTRSLRFAGVIVHRMRYEHQDIAHVRGIPVTTIERTLLDLAAVSGRRDLERAMDLSLSRRLTHISRLRMYASTSCKPGRAGSALVQEMLAARDGLSFSESELERRFLRLLSKGGLPKPRQQFDVTVQGSRFRVDFAFPFAKLIVETDGYAFHSGKAAFQRDRWRDNLLRKAGWIVLRFTWDDVMTRPGYVLENIREVLMPRLCASSDA